MLFESLFSLLILDRFVLLRELIITCSLLMFQEKMLIFPLNDLNQPFYPEKMTLLLCRLFLKILQVRVLFQQVLNRVLYLPYQLLMERLELIQDQRKSNSQRNTSLEGEYCGVTFSADLLLLYFTTRTFIVTNII